MPPNNTNPLPVPKLVASTTSTSSLVIKGPSARQATASTSSLELITRRESGLEVYDVVCALLLCPTHQKIGFCKINSWKGLYMPLAEVSPVTGFLMGLQIRMKQLLQHPDSSVGYIPFKIDADNCEYVRIQVPVVNTFVTRVTYKVTVHPTTNELCCKDIFSVEWWTTEDCNERYNHLWGPEAIILISNHTTNLFKEFPLASQSILTEASKKQITAAGYSDADVKRIFCDWFQHVFPSTQMSLASLIKYLQAIGMITGKDDDHTEQVCKAFTPDPKKCLTFCEFLFGLITVDSETPFQSVKGYRTLRQVAANKESLENIDIDSKTYGQVSRLSSGVRKVKENCFKCITDSFTYPTYAVTMTESSLIVDPMPIAFDEEELQQKTTLRVLSREQVDHSSIGNTVIRWIHAHAEFHSGIKAFPKVIMSQEEVSHQSTVSLWTRDMNLLAEYVIKMSTFVTQVMLHESRLVERSSPCYAIGSLFASLADLLTIERMFWPRGIVFEAGSVIFMGNTIEVGDHSLEVIFYLLAIKSLAPEKVVLLRGQTEQRSRLVKVKSELKQRFGDTDVMRKVRECICQVFDVMPIAALVNGHDLVTSSNIPMSIGSVTEINKIPCPLQEPEKDKIVSEIMLPMDYKKEKQVREQMSRLSISTLIRSFECSTRGAKRSAAGKIITIFSHTNMQNGKNPSAIVLIAHNRISTLLIQDPRFPIRSGSQSSLQLHLSSSSSTASSSSSSSHSPKSSSMSSLLLVKKSSSGEKIGMKGSKEKKDTKPAVRSISKELLATHHTPVNPQSVKKTKSPEQLHSNQNLPHHPEQKKQ